MRTQKIIGMIIVFLAICTLAMAQPPGAPGGTPGKAHQGKAAASKLDMTPVFVGMDTNKDGKIDKKEWLASGMPKGSYDTLFTQMLDKNKDGYLSKAEILAAIPRFKVDTNGDGKVSLEEFVTANKKAAAQMKAGGGPGGARGGAPGGAGQAPPQ